jgi:hypothetical protein
MSINGSNMGLGAIGQPQVIFKRKFRWAFQVRSLGGGIILPHHWCKTANRPQLDIEETEVPFLNQTTWFPGRAKWQPLSINILDPVGADLGGFYNWVASIYNFTQPAQVHQTEKRGWNAEGVLEMYDGCGAVVETWILGSIWPQSVNFGDLDMSSSEIATIDITFRYSDVRHEGGCGATFNGSCVGC